MEDIKTRIKNHEGYRLEPYKDTLGYLTGGWGHKILNGEEVPKSKEGWQSLFDDDYIRALKGANSLIQQHLDHTDYNALAGDNKAVIQGVLTEMCFQLGETGVSKFKNMFKYLGECNFKRASQEMKDSRWHEQTKARCIELSNIIHNL